MITLTFRKVRILDLYLTNDDTYIALGGQVGLHSHGVFDHQLCSDLAEQV